MTDAGATGIRHRGKHAQAAAGGEAPVAKKGDEPKSELSIWDTLPDRTDVLIATAFFFVSLVKLFYRIDLPSDVVWDEAHFTKFATWYYTGHYFVDIHPPLAKMIMAIFIWLSGFESAGEVNVEWWTHKGFVGTRDWLKIYENHTYIWVRKASAVVGSFLVAAMYLSVRSGLRTGRAAAFFAAWLVICDNYITLDSRLILTDVYLWFFGTTTIGLSFMSTRRGLSLKAQIFWTVMTGLSLGCVMSVKYTSGGIIAFVATHQAVHLLYTFYDDYKKLSASKKRGVLLGRTTAFLKEATWKALVIVLLAGGVFVVLWIVHIRVLPWSGQGDNFMGQDYRSQLRTPGVALKPGEKRESGSCPNHAHAWYDCGNVTTTPEQCQAMGCCWDTTSPRAFCYPIAEPPEPPRRPIWTVVREVLVATWQSNQAASQKYHIFMSRWWEWPFQTCKLNLFDSHGDYKIWGIGNPIGWWIVAVTMILVGFLLLVYVASRAMIFIMLEGKVPEKPQTHESPYSLPVSLLLLCLLIGYLANLMPFYFIDRSTWNYHYMLALLCGIACVGLATDMILSLASRWGTNVNYTAQGILIVLIILVGWAFFYWAPWTYGLDLTHAQHEARRWIANWTTSYPKPPPETS